MAIYSVAPFCNGSKISSWNCHFVLTIYRLWVFRKILWVYATSTTEQIHRSRWPRLIDVDYICSHNHWPLMVLSIPKVCFVIRMFGILECYISEWNTTLMGCIYTYNIMKAVRPNYMNYRQKLTQSSTTTLMSSWLSKKFMFKRGLFFTILALETPNYPQQLRAVIYVFKEWPIFI